MMRAGVISVVGEAPSGQSGRFWHRWHTFAGAGSAMVDHDGLRREQDRLLSRSLTVTQFLVAIGTIVGAMVVPIVEATRIIDALGGVQVQMQVQQSTTASLQQTVQDLTVRVTRMEAQVTYLQQQGARR